MLLLEQLCDEIAENGFNKILVVNSHGGNGWLSAFARNLEVKPRKFVFGYTMTKSVAPHLMGEMLLENGTGSIPELTPEDEQLIIKYHKQGMLTGHACMHEASLVMATAPGSVHLDRLGIEDGRPRDIPALKKISDAGIKISSATDWIYTYPDWYTGDDPVGLNERIAEAAARISSEHLAKAYKVFKEDTYLLEQAKKSYKDKNWFRD